MITLSAFGIFGVAAAGFVIVPTAFSLFCKNQKINKTVSTIGIISYSALNLFLALPARNFQNFMLTLNFTPCSPWFNRMFSIGLNFSNPFEVAVNLFMLAPLGLMASMMAKSENKKGLKRALILGFALSLTIEVCQMILPFGRFPTIIDICCNVLGAGIGCACLAICHKIKDFFVNKKLKKQKKNKNEENFEEVENKNYTKLESPTKKLQKISSNNLKNSLCNISENNEIECKK